MNEQRDGEELSRDFLRPLLFGIRREPNSCSIYERTLKRAARYHDFPVILAKLKEIHQEHDRSATHST